MALQACGGGGGVWVHLVAGFPTSTAPKLQRGVLAFWPLARAQSRYEICCCQLEE